MNLSKVHEALIPALAGAVDCSDPNTLGVVEGAVVGATLLACDQALKNLSVTLAGLWVTRVWAARPILFSMETMRMWSRGSQRPKRCLPPENTLFVWSAFRLPIRISSQASCALHRSAWSSAKWNWPRSSAQWLLPRSIRVF